MHPCLNVDEILRRIACELVESGGKGTAVALACCCKSFEDPVLDALWVEQGQLLPLLKSFPRDVWNEGGCSSFKRLPTAIEWARFRKYTRRMRELKEFDTLRAMSLEALSVIQLYNVNEPLLPNLKTLKLFEVDGPFIPLIPLFLSPRITYILLSFNGFSFNGSDPPVAMVASMVATLPRLCPNLQAINLRRLPRDQIITAAVRGMVLATNRNTLQQFHVASPLTEEANEVVYKLPNLRDLFVVIERDTSLPSVSLPNLIDLTIKCENEDNWPRLFQGATLGKLESVTFYPQSEEIGDFLGAFERVALSSSIQNTLSKFYVSASCSWNPTYSSLLSFTHMVNLDISFSCNDGCSSTVDDDTVIDLSRAMPKLRELKLGNEPCEDFPIGVTAKGLVALALQCPGLWYLCIHFQAASLSASPASPGISRSAGPTGLWTDCALRRFVVGEIPVPEESVPMVALTLLRIFPRIESIDYINGEWKKVEDAIHISTRILECSTAALGAGS